MLLGRVMATNELCFALYTSLWAVPPPLLFSVDCELGQVISFGQWDASKPAVHRGVKALMHWSFPSLDTGNSATTRKPGQICKRYEAQPAPSSHGQAEAWGELKLSNYSWDASDWPRWHWEIPTQLSPAQTADHKNHEQIEHKLWGGLLCRKG